MLWELLDPVDGLPQPGEASPLAIAETLGVGRWERKETWRMRTSR